MQTTLCDCKLFEHLSKTALEIAVSSVYLAGRIICKKKIHMDLCALQHSFHILKQKPSLKWSFMHCLSVGWTPPWWDQQYLGRIHVSTYEMLFRMESQNNALRNNVYYTLTLSTIRYLWWISEIETLAAANRQQYKYQPNCTGAAILRQLTPDRLCG